MTMIELVSSGEKKKVDSLVPCATLTKSSLKCKRMKTKPCFVSVQFLRHQNESCLDHQISRRRKTKTYNPALPCHVA